ncbi:MAG: hypothetical protein ORO03_05125, partial [Alphaproteobacteria bacterium]|nr:hypothetical protein [Alphaproteobacteria bacterium]
NNHITLGGAVTILGSYLRLDAGTMNLKGGYTITALGLDVYYTSAKTGNAAIIAVGSGSFTFVNDKRAEAGDLTLNSGANSGGWGTGLGDLVSGTAVGGLTVTTTGDDSTIRYQGLVRSGGVEIQALSTDSAKLRYIEGAGVGVFGFGAAASGSLMLVSSGSGFSITGSGCACGITILTHLFSGTGGSGYGSNGNPITLIQTGLVNDDGIRIKQASNDGAIQNLSVAGNLTITQFGRSNADGIYVENFALKAAGNIVATQVGAATVAGIRFKGGSKAIAGGSLTLLQSGISAVGIALMYNAVPIGLTANDGLLLRTMNTSLVLYGATAGTNVLIIESAKTTIDLGRGTIASLDLAGSPHAAPGLRITALS